MVSVARMPHRFRENVAFTKGHFAVLLLLVNSFSWYYFGQLIVAKLTSVSENSLSLLFGIAFPLSIILSALAGAIFLSKLRETRTLYGWLFSGAVASLLPALPIGNSFAGILAIIVVLGCSLGLGMPLLLRRFTDSMPIENRGVIGGLTFFMVTISAPIAIIATSNLDLPSSALFLSVWRCWSIPTLRALPKRSESQANYERGISFRDVFDNRAFVLYFAAWLMFSMVDGFEEFVTSQYQGEFDFAMTIVEPIIAGFSALIGGIFADRTGRKKVVIFGFVSLGIAYAACAVLGISSQWSTSWLLYFVVDGIAIGLLWAMFTIVIWGELATRGTEKYYAVGEVPFFLTQILYLSSKPYVLFVPYSSAFSLAAFFLFIAVIPLLYAPETLPEKKIQERQLKMYTEEALKVKQKAKPH
jgi:hypothetical protein